MAIGVDLVLSRSGDDTILGGTVNISVQGSPVSSELPILGRPRSMERLVTRAGIGVTYELSRIFQARLTQEELIRSLVRVADCAYTSFRPDIVESVGSLLGELATTRESAIAGRFYRALGMNRAALGDVARTTPMFEAIVDEGPSPYRGRALVALAAAHVVKNDPFGSLTTYGDAMRVAAAGKSLDLVTFFIARKQMAVVRAMIGDHRGSLDELEALLPLARPVGSLQPYLYYDYLNALAVELAEDGKLEHAQRASGIAVASPFASVFPAFSETFAEIVEKQSNRRRSVATVSGRTGSRANGDRLPQKPQAPRSHAQPDNLLVLRAPDREADSESKDGIRTNESARVIDFQEWKAHTKTPAHLLPGALTPDQRATMTTGEKLIRLMDLISRDDTDDEMIDKILDTVEAIVLNGQRKELD